MRADRLISILFALQHGRPMTVRELAQRLEVSARTVTRDLEALSASGVPVYAERGYRGGWRLAEGFRARFNGLKRDDVERLLLAKSSSVRLFADLGMEREYRETWEKLLSAASAGMSGHADAVRERIHIDGAGWRESFEALPLLPALYDAVWSERALAIRYGGDEAERELLPFGLVAKGNVWYVVGRTNGDIRTYRASRIRELRATGETFERPSAFDLAAYWAESTAKFQEKLPSYPATLSLSEAALEKLKRQRFVRLRNVEPIAKESTVAASRDGRPNDTRYRVDADLQTEEYAVECLLALGGVGVAIEEPSALKAAVREAVKALAAAYGAWA